MAGHAAALLTARDVLMTYTGRIQAMLLSLGGPPTRTDRAAYHRYLWSSPGLLRRIGLRALRHMLPWSKPWQDPGELELIRIALRGTAQRA